MSSSSEPSKARDPKNESRFRVNAADVRDAFVVLIGDGLGEREYRYDDGPTEREFAVRRIVAEVVPGTQTYRYFLEEYIPNGRMCDVGANGYITRAWEEPLITQLEVAAGPNGLMAALRERGVDPDKLVKVGGGFGVGSIYHDSLDACAEAIVQALTSNTRYVYHRPLTPSEETRLARETARSSHAYWQAEVAAAERSWDQESVELFKGCYTPLGAPLPDDAKKRILSYLNRPRQQAWDDLRSLCVVGGATLWQAWCESSPRAPRMGSGNGFPKARELRLAIRELAQSRLERARRRLATTAPGGLVLVK